MTGAVHFFPERFSLAEVACVGRCPKGRREARSVNRLATQTTGMGEGQATKGPKVAKMAA